jgi:hypothetical protein
MWFISRRPGKRSRDYALARRFVPRLEILENRTVPSTLTVLNNLDSGAGSLRDAITHAKDGDTIVFNPSLKGQTITLTSDQITINNSLDIEGPGAGLLTISGNDTNRVFDISEGLTVTIAGLTITHGRAQGAGSGGGGILNVGSTLIVANDVLSNNEAIDGVAADGGAIANRNGATLTVSQSTFIGNQAIGSGNGASGYGGGINNIHGSTATVSGSTFKGNRAIGGGSGGATSGQPFVGLGEGGGIYNEGTSSGATLTVENSTFTGNQAIGGNGGSGGKGPGFSSVDSAFGGGIMSTVGGTLVVSGSAFAYNQAIGGSNAVGATSGASFVGRGEGGGLRNAGVGTVTNSTFIVNEALGGSGSTGGSNAIEIGAAEGGGLANGQTSLTVNSCTFSSNQAVGGAGNTGGAFPGAGIGGALANSVGVRGAAATATVSNSTFRGNEAVGGQGSAGANGADGLGGGLANVLGATLTVSSCTLTGNQAIGGTGGAAGNGGNGFGGGIYNDGLSLNPDNAGSPATLTVTGSIITDNQATSGTAGSGGNVGQGLGGGVYFASGGVVCLDPFTSMSISGNTASTSNDDVFGVFAIC